MDIQSCELCGKRLHPKNIRGVCKTPGPCKKEWSLRTYSVKDYDFCSCGNKKSRTSKECWECRVGDGRHRASQGYVQVYVPEDHPNYEPGKRMLEHRLIIEKSLGRTLTKYETVHHKNGVRDDNRLENLQLRQGRHGKGAAFECADCGSHNVIAVELQ